MSEDVENLKILVRNTEQDVNALGFRVSALEIQISNLQNAVRETVFQKLKRFFVLKPSEG